MPPIKSSRNISDGDADREWDFETAIKLIRHQTESLHDFQYKCEESKQERDHGRSSYSRDPDSLESARNPILGNFDVIFSYLKHTKQHQDAYIDRGSSADLMLNHSHESPLNQSTSDKVPELRSNNDRSVGLDRTSETTTVRDFGFEFMGEAKAQYDTTSLALTPTSYRCSEFRLAEGTQGQRDSQSSSDSFIVNSEIASNADVRSKKRREVIRDLIQVVGASTGRKPTKKENSLVEQKKHSSQENYTLRPALRHIPTLSQPSKKVEIMKILGIEACTVIGGLKAYRRQDASGGLTFLPPQLPPLKGMTDGGVHVFVDISNILVGFHDTLKQLHGISKETRIPRVPLSFFNLALILERGRPIVKAVLAGSDTLESVEEARQMGYEVNILERVYKRRAQRANRSYDAYNNDVTSAESENDAVRPIRRVEQGVDEILHLKIAQTVLDNDCPGTIVLATGDAAAAEYSDGFLRMVERAMAKGWKVELAAFRENMSSAYRNHAWIQQWHGAFRVIDLDLFAELLRLD